MSSYYSHHGWSEAIDMTSLNMELGKEVHTFTLTQ